MYVPYRFTQTPFFLKKTRRRVYPLYLATSFVSPGRLTYGIRRCGGRGLSGGRTVFSKGSWAVQTRYHVRAGAADSPYVLSFVAGFVPRVRNHTHSAVLKTALGGYALVAATQHLALFSFSSAAPSSALLAAAA
jgi:hypothetical protein